MSAKVEKHSVLKVTMETTSQMSKASGVCEEQEVEGSRRGNFLLRITALAIAVLILLWFILLNELRVQWLVNPQYSYGWVVPLLVIGLLVRRWSNRATSAFAQHDPVSLTPRWLMFLFVTGAAAILPLRLLLEATPGWRTLNLLLALCTIALTLILLYLAAGPRWTWYFAFPICFILVAVPWPQSLEDRLIQGLTRVDANSVVEIMGLFGVPAMQHGNVIEVSTGTVGIDEACSGIRSFQSSLMISLFLGEFFRLRLRRRLLLVPLGFLIAFSFNVCRTGILTWLAANQGLASMARHHDQTGITILLASSATLWLIAWFLHARDRKAETQTPEAGRRPVPRRSLQPSEDITPAAADAQSSSFNPQRSSLFQPVALFLLLWLILVEAGVELWYRAHETHSLKNGDWTLIWPPHESTFREVPIPEPARNLLRYDEGHAGSWLTDNSANLLLYYFRWLPGRLSLASARSHNPDICLAAAGKQLRRLEDNHCSIQIGPLVFPFRRYEFIENGHVVCVFHCLWEERAAGTYFEFDPGMSPLRLRLQATLEGRRNSGQRSLEFVISGFDDSKAAEATVAAQLKKLIKTATTAR